MPGEPVEAAADFVDSLGGQPRRERLLERQLGRVMCIHVPGHAVGLRRGESEGLDHVLEHRAGPVGDHVGDHGGPFSTVPAVAVLDDLLAALRLEIQIDVGRAATLLGQEPLERQAEADGIDPGEIEAAAHRRVGARTPYLAHDVLVPGEVDDVPHHEEVAGEAEALDDVKFVGQTGGSPRLDPPRPVRIHLPGALEGEVAQVIHLGAETVGHGEVGQPGRHQPQVEGHVPAQGGGPFHCSRILAEPDRHLAG